MATTMFLRTLFSGIFVLLLFAIEIFANETPETHPFYPGPMARSGDNLLITSTNANLKYGNGALFSIDISLIELAILSKKEEVPTLTDDGVGPFYAQPIPSHASFFAKSETQNNVYLLNKGESQLSTVDQALADCMSTKPGKCNDIPSKKLQTLDAKSMAIFARGSKEFALIAFGGNGQLEEIEFLAGGSFKQKRIIPLFTYVVDTDTPEAHNVKVQKIEILKASDSGYAQDYLVAALTMPIRKDDPTRNDSSIALTDANRVSQNYLVWTPLENILKAKPKKSLFNFLNLSSILKSNTLQDFMLLPKHEQLIVISKDVSSIAAFELEEHDAKLKIGQNPKSKETCSFPLKVAYAPSTDLLYVTCFEKRTILGIDPLSLEPVLSNFNFGHGPFELLVDESDPSTPLLYVSFYLDGSIGVYTLMNEDGEATLTPALRIFTQGPANHEGGL